MILPTIITLSRIVATPYIAHMMLNQKWTYALLLFISACITDLLDGWAARKFQQQSIFGQFLDPLADKTLLITMLCILASIHRAEYFFYVLSFLIIKEIILILGAAWLWLQYRFFIKPTFLSRIISSLEMVIITLCCIQQILPIPNILIQIVVLTTVSTSVILLHNYAFIVCKRVL